MLIIEPATPAQAGVLTTITLAAKRQWNYPEAWIQLWLSALTISSQYILENEVRVGVENEKLIAYYSLEQQGEYLWLDNLWVLPEFMGQGIGRQLFQHALERSRVRAVSILKIEADPHAQAFYEKMGASKISEHQTQVDGQLRILPVMEIHDF